MPLDPRLPLMVQPIQAPPPADQLGPLANVLGIVNAQQGIALKDLQTRALSTEIEQKETGRQALADLYGGKISMTDLATKAPEVYQTLMKSQLDQLKLRGDIEKSAAETAKAKYEVGAQKAERAANILAGAKDQGSYELALHALVQNFGEGATEGLPLQYDPKLIAAKTQEGLKLKDRLEIEAKRQDTAFNQGVKLKELAQGDQRVQIERANSGISAARLTEDKRHHAAIEGDPTTIENTAQAIASGNLAPLSGFALAKPMGQQIMARVMALNPTYSAKDFNVGLKAEKDFSTGKQGNAVRSFNVALSHLDTLDRLADALNNRDTQVINRIGNAVSSQMGVAAPTNFDAAKKIVGDEIVKAIVGSGGGVTDREEAARTLDKANSPAQLKGVINTYKELMKGQLHGLRQQYETSTGRKNFDRFLSPEALATDAPSPSTFGLKPAGR